MISYDLPHAQVQTEREKLLRKCLDCSDSSAALQLATRLGVDVEKEAKKAGLELPEGVRSRDLP